MQIDSGGTLKLEGSSLLIYGSVVVQTSGTLATDDPEEIQTLTNSSCTTANYCDPSQATGTLQGASATPISVVLSGVVGISTSNGATVCPLTFSGSWSGTTCTVQDGFTVSSGATLNIGAGVTVNGGSFSTSEVQVGVWNHGTINNLGTLTGTCDTGGDCIGIQSNGVINNNGTVTGNGNGAGGINSNGDIYNYGVLSGPGNGVQNYGNIYNYGTVTGVGQAGASGIYNQADIYNYGTLSTPSGSVIRNFGSSGSIWNTGIIASGGGIVNDCGVSGGALTLCPAIFNDGNIGSAAFAGDGGYAIQSEGTIKDYCGVTITGTFDTISTPPTAISCYNLTFTQTGLPSTAHWGVSVLWVFGPIQYSGTGSSISVKLANGPFGVINYAFSSPVTSSGTTYYCSSGCTVYNVVLSSAKTFAASYLQQTTTSVSCSPSSVNGATPTTCTATVNGGSSPTGTVTFSSTSGTGSFNPSNGQCTLASGSCSVKYADAKAGSPTITASYGGDSRNGPSSGTTSPTILTTVYYDVTFSISGIPTSDLSSWGVNVNGVEYTQSNAGTTSLNVFNSILAYPQTFQFDGLVSAGAAGQYACTTGCSGTLTGSGGAAAIYVSTSVLSQASCISAEFGGSWSGSTCTVNSASITSGQTLQIPSGVSLAIGNDGAFTNSGTINIEPGGSLVITGGYYNDNGNGVGETQLTNDGVINNAGAIYVQNSQSDHYDDGNDGVDNYGTINNGATGAIDVANGNGVGIWNYGAILNSGDVDVENVAGLYDGYGDYGIYNQATFTNQGCGALTGNDADGYNGIGIQGPGIDSFGVTIPSGGCPPATTTLSTHLASSSIQVGRSATDTAALTGANSPTGSIAFTVYSDSACTVSVFTSTGALSGVSAVSAPFAPSSAGPFYWAASYPGDSRNAASSSVCGPTGEVLNVLRASPVVTSTASIPSIILGGFTQTLEDAATLSGGFNPTGTITFTLVSPGGLTVDSETVAVAGDGAYTTVTGYTLPTTGTVAGNYQWHASYSGDANNVPASDLGGAPEQVIVLPALTFLATTASPSSVTPGGSLVTLDDTATLSGGYSPTGILTFVLISPASTVVDTEIVPVSGNGVYTTPGGFTLPTSGAVSGTYQWVVQYSGDGNNEPFTGGPESVVVSTTTTSTSVMCTPNSVASGTSTTCTATVSGANGVIAGETVSFASSSATGVFAPVGGSCQLSSSDSCSVSYTDPTSGAPLITSNYSGDSVNSASTGSFILANFATQAISTATSQTTLSGGSASVDQTSQTGVSTSISGSSGTSATVFSAYLGNTGPAGAGTLSLGNSQYYDVKVNGISSGNAQVCITATTPFPSDATMQYWDGSNWVTASGITISGPTICGEIPVASLTGTNIVTGDPSLSIAPTSVGPYTGTTIALTGAGFAPDNTYLACLSTTSVSTASCVAGTTTGGYVVGSDGSYSSSIIVPPSTTAGSYYVIVYTPGSSTPYLTSAFTITTPLVVSLSSSASSIADDGVDSATFTAAVSGGSGVYTGYSWSLPDGLTASTGCGPSDASCGVTSDAPGPYSVSVSVTDSDSNTATSSPVSLTVTSTSPVLTISPSSVGPDTGTTITLTGANFSPPGTYLACLSTSHTFPSYPCVTTPVGSVVGPDGSYSGSIVVPPSLASGPYFVTVALSGSIAIPIQERFTINASSIVLSPSSGYDQQSFTITGSGFAPGESVSITFVGTSWGSATSSSTGSWTSFSDVPFNAAVGPATVKASGSTGDSASATFTVTPAPTLGLSPNFGGPGSTFSATGSNFPPGGTVSITFATSSSTVTLGSTVVDSSGSFTAIDLIVPSSSPGGFATVQATDGGSAAAAVFDVTPEIILSVSSGFSGEIVGVTGNSFTPGESVAFSFGGFGDGGSLVSSTGSFTAEVEVPSIISLGTTTVTVSGISGDSASATFTVVPPPSITLSQTSGFSGTSVTVSGSSFLPSSDVEITFGPPTFIVGLAVPDGSGSFTIAFSVPAETYPGSYTVQAADGPDVANADFTVPLLSPSITLTPAAGTAGSSFIVTGSQFVPGSPLTITFGGSIVGSATPSSAESFSTTVVAPALATGTNTVTASGGGYAASATFTVEPALGTPTVTPAYSTIDAYRPNSYTISWTGGTGPYTVTLKTSDTSTCFNAGPPTTYTSTTSSTSFEFTFIYAPSSPGTLYYCASVTDSSPSPQAADSSVGQVTVNAALSGVTVSASPSTIDQGGSSSLTSTTVTGGTSPLSYQWWVRAPGSPYFTEITGANSPSYAFASTTSSTPGEYTFQLIVTDALGYTTDSNFVSVTIITYSVTFGQSGVPASGVQWGVTVGGTDYTGTGPSITVSGLSGTQSFSYDSPVAGATGVQYPCSSGCTGSVSSSSTPVSATYATQYYLTVSSAEDTPTPASGWFDSGSPIPASASSFVDGPPGVQYISTGWTGTGSVPSSGATNSVFFVITAPSSITWTWSTQYSTLASVSCSPDTLPVNSLTTCTATVSDTAGATAPTPTGSAAFTNENFGTFSVASCALVQVSPGVAACSVQYTPPLGQEGTNSVGASYSGDADHTGSTSSYFALTATFRATSTSVSCSPFPVVVNVPVTCTATVTDTDVGTATTPVGTIAFASDGSATTPDSACILSEVSDGVASCQVTYTPDLGAEGSHSFSALYPGGPDYSTSTAYFSLTYVARSTTSTVSCSPSTVVVGDASTCIATVTDVSAPQAPLLLYGSVTFSTDNSGSFSPASCSLVPDSIGQSMCSATYTPALGSEGTHDIGAVYVPDVDHLPSSSITFALTATQRTTSTSSLCSPSTVAVDVATSCTATVTDTSAGAPATPSGMVALSTGGSGSLSSATCSLAQVSIGVASCSFTYTPGLGYEGLNSIGAAYGGDANHVGSSGAASVTVTRATTTTAVSCTPASFPAGSTSSCTATVSGAAGTISAETVKFSQTGGAGAVTFPSPATCALSGTSCSITVTGGSAGPVTLQASYAGDTDNLGSSGTTGATVSRATTATAVSCTTSSFPVLATSKCTATVSGFSPTGTVTWSQGGTGSVTFSTATCALSAGACSVTATGASAGAVTATASYAGDSNNIASSGTASLTITRAATTTQVSCSPLSANAGSIVTCTVTVTGASPTGTVTVSQTGGSGSFSPSPASCTLSSGTCGVTVTLGTAGGVTLTATYSGDSNNLGGSAGTTVSLTVQAGVAVSLVCDQTTLRAGEPTFCQASVYTDDMGFAGGSVAWSVTPAGSGTFAQLPCNSFPFSFQFGPSSAPLQCSVWFTPTASGAETVAAAYSGDASHGTGSDAFTIFTGSSSSEATAVSLTCDQTYPNVNQRTECEAIITSANGAALTGSVAWSVSPAGGSFSNEQCYNLGPFSDGQLQCNAQFTPTAFGAETVTAVYTDGGGHHSSSTDAYLVYAGAGQTDVTTVVLSQIPTSLSITCDQSKPNLNQNVNCEATVNTADAGTPSGTVSWSVSPSGSGTFSNQQCPGNEPFPGPGPDGQLRCSAQFKPSASGAITVTATYHGDAYHASSAHSFVLFAGNTASSTATSLSLTCDQVSPDVNQGTNCQATVTSANGAALTGSVTWSVSSSGEGSFGNERCNGNQGPFNNGQLTCSAQFTPSTAGILTVTATYTESGGHHSSSSDTFILFVGNEEGPFPGPFSLPTQGDLAVGTSFKGD